MNSKERAEALLNRLGQTHLLQGSGSALTSVQWDAFYETLVAYAAVLPEQRALLGRDSEAFLSCEPYGLYVRSGDEKYRLRGIELLEQGKVGCVILAGGQGTRWGGKGPKGMTPVTPVYGKSLFELFATRTNSASIKAGAVLPVAIMTSPATHAQTARFFEEHHQFGLKDLSLFCQQQLPFIDASGCWQLDAPGSVACGPDGNGHALHLLFQQRLWHRWKAQGVEYVNVIFVDNALADPFDPDFIGFTALSGLDAALKAVERSSPEESMGIVAQTKGKMRVIEYIHLPKSAERFTLSSTGMFCVTMPFIEILSQCSMPLHLAYKETDVWDAARGNMTRKRLYKSERFLFDLLAHTTKSAPFVCPRNQVYAPLKTADGERGLSSLQQLLLSHDSLFW